MFFRPFDEYIWSFNVMRLISQAHFGGGQFSEIHEAIARIREGDAESWYAEWHATAERVEQLVKSEVFLTDPFHITGLDEVWRERFPSEPPARTIFAVDGLGVEGGVVEINHIAVRPSSGLERRTIATPNATQLAHDDAGIATEARPKSGFPHVGSPGRLEASYILDAVRAIFEAAGGSLADVAKVQTHLTDLGQFDAVNEVWKRAFPDDPPAWTVVGMRSPLPVEGAGVLCDVVGCLDTGRATP